MPPIRLKIDLHVHSHYSDGLGTPEDILEHAMKKGLDGLAITDHNTLDGYFRAREIYSGLFIVPGFEVTTEAGHILVLGLDERARAVEVMNASYPLRYFVWRGLRLCERLGVTSVGGSDAHSPRTVGDAYTIVEVRNISLDDVLKAIRNGNVWHEGGLSPLSSRLRIGLGYVRNMFF